MNDSPVEKLAFALVYADNLKTATDFYKKHFNFVEDNEVKMGADQVYGTMGPVGIWIGGGYKKSSSNKDHTRATVMLRVKSCKQLIGSLKSDNVQILLDPAKMNETTYWFQFSDPCGNIWDILGNE